MSEKLLRNFPGLCPNGWGWVSDEFVVTQAKVNYLDVLQTTLTLRVVRPYFGGSVQELVKQPKLYGFDTGFVCHTRSIDSLREDDCGSLWEHMVLDMLSANVSEREVSYWRDKQGHEVDFVVPGANGALHAIECKWNVDAFDPGALRRFRALYPAGLNLLVAPNALSGVSRQIKSMQILQAPLDDLPGLLSSGV